MNVAKMKKHQNEQQVISYKYPLYDQGPCVTMCDTFAKI